MMQTQEICKFLVHVGLLNQEYNAPAVFPLELAALSASVAICNYVATKCATYLGMFFQFQALQGPRMLPDRKERIESPLYRASLVQTLARKPQTTVRS